MTYKTLYIDLYTTKQILIKSIVNFELAKKKKKCTITINQQPCLLVDLRELS